MKVACVLLVLQLDKSVFEEASDRLAEIGKSRERCEVLQYQIHLINAMFMPVVNRRYEAQKFIDIKISPNIMRQLDKEMQ